ncbi:MAG: 50S ribosomal protein L17 [Cytophagales bacterium]|nr:50S ribosomal protein L17 [Cytophagales bacterium]
MRHGKKFNHLSRTTSHRGAMLSNMASSLIKHKRINTTVAKAKALRKYIEPLITKAKSDTTHSRRVAFSYLQDKETIQELFSTVAEKVANRPGGYTRIIKTVNRLGDNADMCMMELVDFNELMLQDKPAKAKSRRSRRGGKKSGDTTSAAEVKTEEAVVEEVTEEVIEDAVVVDEVGEAEVVEETAEAASTETESAEEASSEEPQIEESSDEEEKKD